MLCPGMTRNLSTRAACVASLAGMLGAAGCGGAAPRVTAPPATPASTRQQVQRDRIVLRGDVAPEEYGPFALDGRYRVRFVQRGARVDFTTEVPFAAHLEQAGTAGAPREVRLFERAAASGATTITAHGRRRLLVDFGDSPFEVTLTRLAGG